ncbi:MAG: hypothetical protein KDC65_10655 [Saprospiraceae bacterium]|nr:hypothetical protein [Saprospiraceae bacterium]
MKKNKCGRRILTSMSSKQIDMKQQHSLEQLRSVKKVETPPFLLTRINAKIAAQQAEALPSSWQWAGALAFGLMLLFNVMVVRANRQTGSGQGSVETLAYDLQMTASNQLYHE